MKDLFSQNAHRPLNYTIVYLFTLLLILSVLAIWARIRGTIGVDWLPQIDNAQDVVSFFSILMVAYFGITVLVLKSRFHALETEIHPDQWWCTLSSVAGLAATKRCLTCHNARTC